MLSPDDRSKLVESLAPPPGHVLELAVGTTYSLNLDALLTAPAAFALFRTAAEGASLVPVEIIDSIQRHADRITVFHQTGQISVPKGRLLFGLVEAMVVPVRAPQGGIFHPKIWVLRYREEATGHPRYRFLCASRNLTHDASWDTLLRLDSDAQSDHTTTLPGLGTFVRALPTMAIDPLPEARQSAIATLADEVDTVRFALPKAFDRAHFHGLGLEPDTRDPLPPDAESLLVISPFLALAKVKALARRAKRSILVSRHEEIERLGRGLEGFTSLYVLDPDAHPTLTGESDTPAALVERTRRSFADPDCTLLGLHAKLYVFDTGDRTRVFTGSANASNAAFSTNVEALVELQGRARECGVDAMLGEEGGDAPSLRALLWPAVAGAREPEEIDEVQASLDRLRYAIGEVPLRGEIEAVAGEDRYVVRYRSDDPLPDLDGATLRLWPITIGEAYAQAIAGAAPIDTRFEVSFEGLSRFVAAELAAERVTTRFVLCAELVGAPADRRARLVRALLKDSNRVLRYLLMLLMDRPEDRFDATALLKALEDDPTQAPRRAAPAAPLLEALLRTLRREPARLRALHEFVQGLGAEEETAKLLPEGFEQIWEPIWTLAQEVER